MIAISLSMDAFSLALTIGTLKLSTTAKIFLSSTVGIFHFFMPLMGHFLGAAFVRSIEVDMHIISGCIFLYIAILMFKDFKEDEEFAFKLSFLGACIFALGVSLDSFGVGFALPMDIAVCIKSFFIFTLCSSLFTYIGLNLGTVLNGLIGKYSVLLGSLIMTILGIINFCQFFS